MTKYFYHLDQKCDRHKNAFSKHPSVWDLGFAIAVPSTQPQFPI
ncbi:MAG: hypothetical protein RM021_033680 [Nostoc sp. EkiNYC01]|nr:hypothetical protein [Nostoc sp. EkiNYC01]